MRLVFGCVYDDCMLTLYCTYILQHCLISGLRLTSSVTGRHACPSEEVTFTCTARGHVIFWGNEGFGEITVHNRSSPTRGKFRAAVESYEFNNNCLVSSLSFSATASRSRTTVICTNRERSLRQSLALHIMSMFHNNIVGLQFSCRSHCVAYGFLQLLFARASNLRSRSTI